MLAGTNLATVIPVVVSSIVALVGLILTVLNRRDKNAADAKERDRLDDKERLDTLTVGQQWVVDALKMERAESDRLRGHIALMRQEFADAEKEWKTKAALLEAGLSRCSDECAKLKRAVERKQ